MSKTSRPSRKPTPAQIAASRANGKKSRGPTSDSGKDRSRLNSFKHGLTGSGRALPFDVQAELDEQSSRWNAAYQPMGPLEEALVFQMALASFRIKRTAIQECNVLSLKARGAVGAYDREVRNNVEQLGIRLLNDPVPRASGDAILPSRDHPIIRKWQVDEPIILVMELKETVQGCDYLLERWKELEFMLANEGYWHFDSKFKAIRMLGKRFETLLDDVLVGDIFACCHALLPEMQEKWVLMCQHATYLAENRPTYHVRLTKLAERIPEDKLVALDFLHGIVAREIEALEARREELLPVHELNRDEAPLRSAFDDSAEGEKRLRYETASERSLHKSLADFLKVRKAAEAGELDTNEASPTLEANAETALQAQAPEQDGPAPSVPALAVQNEPDDRAAPGLDPAPEPRPTAPDGPDKEGGGGPERRSGPN